MAPRKLHPTQNAKYNANSLMMTSLNARTCSDGGKKFNLNKSESKYFN